MNADRSVRAIMVTAAVCGLVLTAGCLMGTTPPPMTEPGMDALPAGNVAAREGIAIEQIRVIKNGEDFYYAQNNKYATLQELMKAGHINASVQGTGYTIEVTVTDDGYELNAVPNEYGPKGKRSFYLDQTGTIRGDDHAGGAAAADDPPI